MSVVPPPVPDAEPPLSQRASQGIARELRRLILSGEIVEDGYLQPTAVLLRRFAVSRPTLREAFRLLENEHVIAVRQGSRRGVQVLQASTQGASRVAGQTLQAIGATIGDLYEALIGFEPFAARLLAARRDRRDIAALRARHAVLEQTRLTASVSAHGAELARFHHLLVDLTGNKVMMLMADLIADALERHQRDDTDDRYAATMSDAEKAQFRDAGTKSIAKLVRLIEAGDADGAEAHWRRHVENANEFWLKAQDRHALINVVR